MKELEYKIREVLPYLKELTKGCIVYDNKSNLEYAIIDNHYCPQLYSYQYSSFRTLEFEELKDFEVIGQPIKLNDVLLWHSLDKRDKYSHFEVHNGEGYFCIYDGEGNESLVWTLSSFLLADQSEKLKVFLNSL